jgi:hypothetical protein
METNRACDCERSGENASERATRLDPYAGAARLIHGRAVAIIMPVPKRKALKRHLRHTELPSPARGESAVTRTALAALTQAVISLTLLSPFPTGRIIGKGGGASDRGAVHGPDHRRWSAGVRGVHHCCASHIRLECANRWGRRRARRCLPVWRHDSGQVYFWEMNGLGIKALLPSPLKSPVPWMCQSLGTGACTTLPSVLICRPSISQK